MALSRTEIQQMLREMNIKFEPDEPYEALKQRLQQKNHSLWLKSIRGRTGSVRVRKRPSPLPPSGRTDDPPCGASPREALSGPGRPTAPRVDRKPVPPSRPIEKPSAGKPWKTAAEGTQPFNRTQNVFDFVLRRARNCCEGCGARSGRLPDGDKLQPFHILPLSQGGQHSVKNVVALCPACREALAAHPSAKTIKDLKRKTRTKLYEAVKTVRKRSVGRRQRHPVRKK